MSDRTAIRATLLSELKQAHQYKLLPKWTATKRLRSDISKLLTGYKKRYQGASC